MNPNRARTKRLLRSIDWLVGPDWERTLTAIAEHLEHFGHAYRELDQHILLDGTAVPLATRARQLRAMYFHDDDRLNDTHLEALDAVGFSFDEPSLAVRESETSPSTTVSRHDTIEIATAHELARRWPDRDEPIPEAVLDWIRTGLDAARRSGHTILGAFAEPDLLVAYGSGLYPLGQFARELARAELGGILTGAHPFLTRQERSTLQRNSTYALRNLAALALLMEEDPTRILRSATTFRLPNGTELAVGEWVRFERERHQRLHNVSPERVRAIASLGIDLDTPLTTQIRARMYEVIDAHYAMHGDIDIPSHVEVALGPNDAINIRTWLTRLRSQAKAGRIGPALRAELATHHIDVDHPFDIDRTWLDAMEALAQYRREPGHASGPVEENTVRTLPSGRVVNLSRFISAQCSRARHNPAYPAHRLEQLRAFGIDLDEQRQGNRRWQRSLVALDAYRREHPTGPIPRDATVTIDGEVRHVGSWLHKTLGRELNDERIADLAARGVPYVRAIRNADRSRRNFDDYRYHLQTGGDPNPAVAAKALRRDGTEWSIGDWLNSQRIQRRSDPARYDTKHGNRVAQLEALGFVWNPRAANWAEGERHFIEFAERFGHGFIAHSYQYVALDGTEFPLGTWVSRRQRDVRVGRLDSDVLDRLERHGFRASDAEARVELDALALRTYALRCRTLAFPDGHEELLEGGKKISLRRASERLREAHAVGEVPDPVVTQLRSFGFTWSPQPLGR